jgi:hypothetical protein
MGAGYGGPVSALWLTALWVSVVMGLSFVLTIARIKSRGGSVSWFDDPEVFVVSARAAGSAATAAIGGLMAYHLLQDPDSATINVDDPGALDTEGAGR